MSPSALPEAAWERLSGIIAEATGLHFPPGRWPDLERGLAGAAVEFGFADVAACADGLLAAPLTPAQIRVLASHLTVGETYFFRENQTLEVLANSILPGLIHLRRGRDQRLRLWSAACCTGEEAYSLAILLQRTLPDLADWDVKILATDINPRFLEKAVAGSYGAWSCRNVPAAIRRRYFDQEGEDRYVVAPVIREMVTFAQLNLAEDVYPSRANDTDAMDMIFCRNVLIYFTPFHIRRVVANFHRALVDGGWLAVSPTEAAEASFPQFTVSNHPGVILYRKDGVEAGEIPTGPQPGRAPALPPPLREAPSIEICAPPEVPPGMASPAEAGAALYGAAVAFREQGRHAEAVATLLALAAADTPGLPVLSLLTRTLSDQGLLADALVWCDRWIAGDKLDAAAHYLRAVILLEQGEQDLAYRSLQGAVYLHPDFVLAHFALGNVARSRGRIDDADKHFSNALHLLVRLPPADVLPESGGITAGRLTETITAAIAQGTPP